MLFIARIFIVLILINANASLSAETGAKTRKIQGVFKEITFSHYMYIDIDVGGTKQTFYCMIPDCDEWEKNQAQYEGKMLQLKIRNKNFYFKELKASRNIDEVLELKVSEPKK